MAGQGQPLARSFVRDGLSYRLEVGQQPQRARMCGFGDKDRRPITPPPCVRLIICDSQTGREVDFNDIDSGFFVLHVDLWDEHAQQEVNLVRHSSTTPSVSISLASTTSYPPQPEPQYMSMQAQYGGQRQVPQYGYPYQPPGQDHYNHGPPGYPPGSFGGPIAPVAPRSAAEMYTRNLIGQVAVNAARLTDTQDKVGFWFVLQDLSVRTEGVFRLKMSFIDVGTSVMSSSGTNGLTSSSAPVLATVYSDPFQVWSAKKFPGVMDSTPLSKCFASQGIKIPIRKDGARGTGGSQVDFDADD